MADAAVATVTCGKSIHAWRRILHPLAAVLGLACMLATGAEIAVAQAGAPFTTVRVPMRDGKSLAADLYVNAGSGAKPTILVQTPYNKNLYRIRLSTGTGSVPYDSSAYHYVVADWRGFYESTDAAVQGYDRGLDGYDLVEWIAAQPWSDGRIGTHGGSALGHIQFLTARHKPPHLVCAVPMVKDIRGNYFDYYSGGVLREEHVHSLERLGFLSVDVITAQPVLTPLWRAVDRASDLAPDIAVPMLIIGGWFDHYPDDVLGAFEELRTRSDVPVRDAHKLIFGPWGHGGLGLERQGELRFPGAVGVSVEAALRFFDYHLRGAKNGWPLEPTVRWFQMGDDEWRSAPSWTGVARDTLTMYLRQGGLLHRDVPDASESWTEVPSDPRNPSPSRGGARFNPFDPRVVDGPLDIADTIESRPDAITFTTPPLSAPLEIRGALTAHLHVSSDRPDADVAVRITEVYPDGRSMILIDGIRRLRFHAGEHVESPVPTGTIVRASVLLQQLGITLPPGHRLRIVISGANHPRYDRNLQNGGAMYAAGDTLAGRLRIHHDAARPSHLGVLVAPGTVAADRPPVASAPGVTIADLHPQPARDGIRIIVDVRDGGMARVRLVDLLGRTAASVYTGELPAGRHTLQAALPQLPAGIYRVVVEQGTQRDGRQLRIIR